MEKNCNKKSLPHIHTIQKPPALAQPSSSATWSCAWASFRRRPSGRLTADVLRLVDHVLPVMSYAPAAGRLGQLHILLHQRFRGATLDWHRARAGVKVRAENVAKAHGEL